MFANEEQTDSSTRKASQIEDFCEYREKWSQDLERLRQNRLLNEGELISFARDRGIAVQGVVTGDLGELYRRGWLTSDGADYKGDPMFHPFRLYPLLRVFNAGKSANAISTFAQRHNLSIPMEQELVFLRNADQIEDTALKENQIANLAILLEPLYWTRITGGKITRRDLMSESAYKGLQDQYRQKALNLVRTLDPTVWREIHKSLCWEAAVMDKNSELYLLLRLAKWQQREQLKGAIAGALWIKHLAEVIRRAFEEVFHEYWMEEDQGCGVWPPGGRKMFYGSERPLDDELQSKSYLAWEYGLFTGSVVRWYVEGETEYYTILHVLSEPSKSGIEIVNLRGVVASERDNIALKLGDWVTEDKALRRFSMISFDMDVPANRKAIRRQVEQGNVVGLIAAHKPDFEFANFTIQELVEVAARIDEEKGFSGESVRNADWTGVCNGRDFEKKYKSISARHPRSLKGEDWGIALAKYASKYPNRPDDGSERPFWREIISAFRTRVANYDFQKEHFNFDRDTFEIIDLRTANTTRGTLKKKDEP